ncbi:putative disease resistance RPP13-like protein 3 [Triticum aestivum]|uniref:putative disease resistance RPP13-like protein 3 n=1 Tax=Triticum aestivum TaxID=4565 RepID=UPI001D002EF8|nr:putative disease resistance RPP13-like protein 3 [Triticum aestivum]
MAEAVVGQLVVTLGAALAKEAAIFGGSLLGKEATALRSLFGKIRESKAELESMQAYLQEAERFKDTDKTTAIFIASGLERNSSSYYSATLYVEQRNLMEWPADVDAAYSGLQAGLAFQVEDVVDEFTYKLEDCKHGGFAVQMKKRLNDIKTWHCLTAMLQEIETKLQDAKRRKKDYTIISRPASAARLMSKGQALHFTRDEDLVGINENKEILIRWLTSGGDGLEQCSSKIITVWGMPGVGKTTLVAHVYSVVKLDFDATAWVTVSESYRIEDLLKKIVAEFGIAVDVAKIEMRGLAESIHNYLQG